MSNPIMYYNTSSNPITTGGGLVPGKAVFVYEANNNKVYLAGSGINSTSMYAAPTTMLQQINAGNFKLAYSNTSGYYQFFNNTAAEVRINANGTFDLWEGYIWGYSFKLKRAAQVFQGTTYQFTLPAEANVIVAGNSVVGATYRQRLAIVGYQVSQNQFNQMTGTTLPGYLGKDHALAGGGWWVDTGAGNSAYSLSSSISIKGTGTGSIGN